jgi:tRNA(fMet)-specific endonuclease VapC
MALYILDTGILLGYVRNAGYVDYVEKKYKVSLLPNISVASIVTVGELYALAFKFGWGEGKKQKLKAVIAKYPVVNLDNNIVRLYADIDAYSQGKHPELKPPKGMSARNMGDNDILIATTGTKMNASLLTVDQDFQHLDGIFLNVIYIDQKWIGEDADRI